MQFQSPLEPARLIRRYKRFLADVAFDDGREATVHVANPGAMTGLAEPGMRVWIEDSGNPKRKLPLSWRLVEPSPGVLACVDTGVANRIVGEALDGHGIDGLDARGGVRAEVRYGEGSRADFLLTGGDECPTWVEVKSVTLARGNGLAAFPDAVTARGARHMDDLAGRVAMGERAAVLFVIQRSDCRAVEPARDIDPAYSSALERAARAGVRVLAITTRIDTDGITLGEPAVVRM